MDAQIGPQSSPKSDPIGGRGDFSETGGEEGSCYGRMRKDSWLQMSASCTVNLTLAGDREDENGGEWWSNIPQRHAGVDSLGVNEHQQLV